MLSLVLDALLTSYPSRVKAKRLKRKEAKATKYDFEAMKAENARRVQWMSGAGDSKTAFAHVDENGVKPPSYEELYSARGRENPRENDDRRRSSSASSRTLAEGMDSDGRQRGRVTLV